MIEKHMRVVVTFHTTAEAIATERSCKAASLPGKLISAPRAITSDCGIAWSSPIESKDALQSLIANEKIEIDSYHDLLL